MSVPVATLLVDDEPLARQRLMRLVSRDAALCVVGCCQSVTDALHCAEDRSPELVLLDVRMPDKDGFALLQNWPRHLPPPVVIFITAHSEHAVAAFNVQAVDYVLKPFDEERLAQALTRGKNAVRAARQKDELTPSRAGPRFAERLLIVKDGGMHFLPTRDIEFLQSAGKCVKVFAQGRCELIRQPLRAVESLLDPAQFVRIHRSSIVNIEEVVQMHPLFHGDCELVLRRGTRMALSRRYRHRFDRFLVHR